MKGKTKQRKTCSPETIWKTENFMLPVWICDGVLVHMHSGTHTLHQEEKHNLKKKSPHYNFVQADC